MYTVWNIRKYGNIRVGQNRKLAYFIRWCSNKSLRGKTPYSEFFWSIFFPHSDWIRTRKTPKTDYFKQWIKQQYANSKTMAPITFSVKIKSSTNYIRMYWFFLLKSSLQSILPFSYFFFLINLSFCSDVFLHEWKRFNKKPKTSFKFYDLMNWEVNNYITHSAQHLHQQSEIIYSLHLLYI